VGKGPLRFSGHPFFFFSRTTICIPQNKTPSPFRIKSIPESRTCTNLPPPPHTSSGLGIKNRFKMKPFALPSFSPLFITEGPLCLRLGLSPFSFLCFSTKRRRLAPSSFLFFFRNNHGSASSFFLSWPVFFFFECRKRTKFCGQNSRKTVFPSVPSIRSAIRFFFLSGCGRALFSSFPSKKTAPPLQPTSFLSLFPFCFTRRPSMRIRARSTSASFSQTGFQQSVLDSSFPLSTGIRLHFRGPPSCTVPFPLQEGDWHLASF